jgi:hypothetical protein
LARTIDNALSRSATSSGRPSNDASSSPTPPPIANVRSTGNV